MLSMSSVDSISSLPSSACKLLTNLSHLKDNALIQGLSISQNNKRTSSFYLLTLETTGINIKIQTTSANIESINRTLQDSSLSLDLSNNSYTK